MTRRSPALLARHTGGVVALRYRRSLVRTAVTAAAAGWPVVPGAWWSKAEGRFVCDVAGCRRTGLHPAVLTLGGMTTAGDGLVAHAIRHPEAVASKWRGHSYSVLMPTGETCDVVDVPAVTGRQLATQLDARSNLGPVISAGSRWFLLTAPGGGKDATALGGDVLVHGQGSWIVLPPSLGPGGEPALWLARPRRTGGVLPRRDDVIRLLEHPAVPAQRRPNHARV